MPRTIIVRQTWRCPTCDSEWDSPVLDGQVCSYCNVGVVRREMNPARCGTLTVIGEEDIEEELLSIASPEKSAYRTKRLREMNEAIVAARLRDHFVP